MPRLTKAYVPRILALDLMRGYFLIAIILNHLHYWPSGFDWLTARGELFVSSAEGFFLISGIVLGIVRGRKLLEKPFKVAASLLLKRGLQLYITYVVLGITFTLLGWAFFINNPGLKDGIAPIDTPLLEMIWNMLSFQYLYGWADYLRLYCMFLFVAPIFLLLLRKNLWWLALLISLAVWRYAPFTAYPESIYWQPLHWQLLFFGGMVIGFHWPELTRIWNRLTKTQVRLVIGTMISLTIVSITYNLVLAYGGNFGLDVSSTRGLLRANYFDKENFPLARLALFGLWFWTTFWIVNHFNKFITKRIGWLLLPFGTNSLYVYTVHAIILFFVHLLVPAGSSIFLLNFTVTTIVLTMIYFMLKKQILFKVIPR